MGYQIAQSVITNSISRFSGGVMGKIKLRWNIYGVNPQTRLARDFPFRVGTTSTRAPCSTPSEEMKVGLLCTECQRHLNNVHGARSVCFHRRCRVQF